MRYAGAGRCSDARPSCRAGCVGEEISAIRSSADSMLRDLDCSTVGAGGEEEPERPARSRNPGGEDQSSERQKMVELVRGQLPADARIECTETDDGRHGPGRQQSQEEAPSGLSRLIFRTLRHLGLRRRSDEPGP